MVPNVRDPGRSFTGAAAYYQHDKGADTSARVAWVHNENIKAMTARGGIAEMVRTFERQDEIKADAGTSARGRKLDNPVFTLSLSWKPGENPDKAHMIETARGALKACGLEGHQAQIIRHTDTAHPHIHIIANLVNPETQGRPPVPRQGEAFPLGVRL